MRRVGIWILAAVLGIGALVFTGYNRLVTQDQVVKSQWGHVEAQFQRRFDLIPNLVRTAKGYMEHEKSIFEEVAKARQGYMQAKGASAKMAAQGEVDSALSRLIAVVENYPQLKANESVQQLMDELAGTENRVAVERIRYNRAVAEYNMRVKRFPGNLVAQLFGFTEESFISSAEGASHAPHVSFE